MQCTICGGKVYITEKIEANGRRYHKSCFKVRFAAGYPQSIIAKQRANKTKPHVLTLTLPPAQTIHLSYLVCSAQAMDVV